MNIFFAPLLAQTSAATNGSTLNITNEEMRSASVFAFQRIDGDNILTVIANFGDNDYTSTIEGLGEVSVKAHDAICKSK